MPRIRSIKPELPADAGLAKVSRGARYTFILLITQADDQGYFIATPRTLLGTLYPHDIHMDEETLVGELDELLKAGRLEAFDSPDGMVGRVVNFVRHQKIDHPSQPFLAKRSRTPRQTFASGVLSLESRVSSLEQDKAGADAPESLGAWYGKTLKPLLYPKKGQSRDDESRDVQCLKTALRSYERSEVEAAVRGARAVVDRGGHWIGERGCNFTLRVLLAPAKDGGANWFERFRDESFKEPKRAERGGKPSSLADLLKGGL